MTFATAQTRCVCRRSRPPAAATPATRTSPARSSVRSASIRPPRSRASSAAPCGLTLRARYERPSLRLAAAHRGAHGAAGAGARRRHLLCEPQRNDGRGDSRAHARQHRLGVVLRRLRCCRSHPCGDRRAQRADRMVAAEGSQRRHLRERFRSAAASPRSARGRRGGAAMTVRHLSQRRNVLWIAALVHRLSGLALAIFLPVHFLTLGLAIHGEAPLESFLRWSDQPLVKLAESGLVFLLLVHMLGGLRLLVIENLPWRDGQKELATIAAGLSAVIALILLARLF